MTSVSDWIVYGVLGGLVILGLAVLLWRHW
jgi:hypothetical protein